MKKKQMWEIKQSIEPDSLDMYIYGYIEGDGYDWWSGTVIESETSANHFKAELAKYPNVKTINLYVNSGGGFVYEAMPIRNQLKRHSATVIGIVDGIAASAASFVLTACDIVKMYSNTMQMVHEMAGCVCGNARDMRKGADDLDAMMVGNRQAYLEKSGGKLTEEKLIELLEAETYLSAAQCLEYGLCDEIIAEQVDMTPVTQMMQKMNLSLQQQIEFGKSLAAQLREISKPVQKVEPPEEIEPAPPAEPEPIEPAQAEPIQTNKIAKLFSALR